MKYKLIEDSPYNGTAEIDLKKGMIVYAFKKLTYGVEADDERASGEHHIAVSLNEDSDYPFYSVPAVILSEIHKK